MFKQPNYTYRVLMRFFVPKASVDTPHVASHEIQKSRFIGWCARVDCIEEADQLLSAARRAYPDASHHCSAYIAGIPGEDQAIGFADDGEPGGTAGRPMYQVLAGSGMGYIGCVVTRYFGGTKLGTGGLARAYAQTVSDLVSHLPTQQYVPRHRLSIDLTFADEQPARAWLLHHEGQIVEATYHGQGVTLDVAWPSDITADWSVLEARLNGRLVVNDDAS